jgi:pimeloyl-ACP methyl ester carboxylesterase
LRQEAGVGDLACLLDEPVEIQRMKHLCALFLALLPSCGLFPRETPVPVSLLNGGKPDGRELVVFLPGRWSRVAEFEREGLFQIARERWPDARLVAPDLHLGYYKNRSMARRLHEDVILPARKTGVRRITVVGISLGGLGALIHEMEYPGRVDEIVLLSPFLGEDEVLREIETAGGLRKWDPGPIAKADFSRKLWLNLRRNWSENATRPRVLLGCGEGDRLAVSNRLFAREFLKSGDQQWIPGSHDWPTWRALFASLTAK